MKQAIAGVAPAEIEEVTVMVVWPSIARYGLGRVMGRLFENQTGMYVFTVGNFCALACIPLALALYFFRLLPSHFGSNIHGCFYKLTNRRVLVLRNEVGMGHKFPWLTFKYGAEDKGVELDRFDAIEIDVKPGQQWYQAGDLVFYREGVETFRLEGVSRPEAFRQTCMKSHLSYVGVKRALAAEPVPA